MECKPKVVMWPHPKMVGKKQTEDMEKRMMEMIQGLRGEMERTKIK